MGQNNQMRSDHAFPVTNHQQYLTFAAPAVAAFTNIGPSEQTSNQYMEANYGAPVATFPSGQGPQTMPSITQHGLLQLTTPEQDLPRTEPSVPPAINFPMLWNRLQNGMEIHADVLAALERALPQFMLFLSTFAPVMQHPLRQPPPNQYLPSQPSHEQSQPEQLLSEQPLQKHSPPKQRAEEMPSSAKMGATSTASKGPSSRRVRTESPEMVVTKAGCRACGFDYISYEEKYRIRLKDCLICSKGGVDCANAPKALPDAKEVRANRDEAASSRITAKREGVSYHHAEAVKRRGAQGSRRRSRSPSKQDARTDSRARATMGVSDSYRQRSPKRESIRHRVQSPRHGRSSAGYGSGYPSDIGAPFAQGFYSRSVLSPSPAQQRRRDPITNKKISLNRHERQARHNDADGNQASSGYGSQQRQQPARSVMSSLADNHFGPWIPFEDRVPGFPERMQREREEVRLRNTEQERKGNNNQRGGQQRRR